MAAACLERSLPPYLEWARGHDSELAVEAAKGLDLLWRYSAGEEAPGRGRVYRVLCEHDPAETGGDVAVDWASSGGWDALRLALEAARYEDGADLIEASMHASYDVVEKPIAYAAGYQIEDEASLQGLAGDERVQAEIAFQEAVLTEVETTARPLTRDQALEISARHQIGTGRER